MPEIHLCNHCAGHSIFFSFSHTAVPTNSVPKQARVRAERDPKSEEEEAKRIAVPDLKARDRDKLGEVRIATGAGGPARARSEAEI